MADIRGLYRFRAAAPDFYRHRWPTRSPTMNSLNVGTSISGIGKEQWT